MTQTTKKKISAHRNIIQLERLPNGDYVNWGRHGPNGAGGAEYYSGEAAEIIDLVIRNSVSSS